MMLVACSIAPVRENSYTVKSGDTLYSIAARVGVDYRELARLNNIDGEFLIHPGQVLRLTAENRTSVSKQVTNKSGTSAAVVARSVPAPVAAQFSWQWPCKSQNFVETRQPNGGVGLTINGQLGQDILASASGKVVYAGSGLLGYGQLIIIKHDEVYLSAYGHLQNMLVQENMQVTAGQKIATMGTGASGNPLLYFEIRVNGVPVMPLPLLPRQNQ